MSEFMQIADEGKWWRLTQKGYDETPDAVKKELWGSQSLDSKRKFLFPGLQKGMLNRNRGHGGSGSGDRGGAAKIGGDYEKAVYSGMSESQVDDRGNRGDGAGFFRVLGYGRAQGEV